MSEPRMPLPTVRVTRYEVSCLPPDHHHAADFTVTVECDEQGRWMVRRGAQVLSQEGVWVPEPGPFERTREWEQAHLFTEAEAVRLARVAVPNLRAGDRTADAVLAGADS